MTLRVFNFSRIAALLLFGLCFGVALIRVAHTVASRTHFQRVVNGE
jgi:hypothetical protein